jgi:hypothetical protein
VVEREQAAPGADHELVLVEVAGLQVADARVGMVDVLACTPTSVLSLLGVSSGISLGIHHRCFLPVTAVMKSTT